MPTGMLYRSTFNRKRHIMACIQSQVHVLGEVKKISDKVDAGETKKSSLQRAWLSEKSPIEDMMAVI